MERLDGVVDDVLACLRPLGYGSAAIITLLLIISGPELIHAAQSILNSNVGLAVSSLKQFGASHLMETLITSAFGAFAGAWMAGRAYTKRAVVAELNAVSAAMTLCFTICNTAMSLKGQHVRRMKQRYDQSQEAYVQARQANQQAAAAGQPLQPVPLSTDFQTLTTPKMLTQGLEKNVFEKISVRGRALVAAATLIGAVDSLEKGIEYRNELILDIRKNPPASPTALAEIYFGLRTANGVTDERFKGCIEAIHRSTDDCIFFAQTLDEDLLTYGQNLRKRYAWRFRLGIPRFEPANWSMAEQENLIPPREDYAAWLRGFAPRPSRFRKAMRWFVQHGGGFS